MSEREDIAGNIISVLDAMSSPELKKITREPFSEDELSNSQFPCAFIQSGSETREDRTMSGDRQGNIDYVIVGFVKGTTSNIDTARNELITGIETALESDRTRSGNALDTQIIEVSTDEGVIYPYGGVRVVVRVLYHYDKGSP